MRAKEFIKEEFFDSFNNKQHNDDLVEIFKNPSRGELIKLSKKTGDEPVRAYLTDNELYVWNPHIAIHGTVRDYLRLERKNALGIYLFYDPAHHNDIDVQVTVNSKDTKWHHNPEVADWIRSRPVWWSNPDDIVVSYYDEDKVGDWEDMTDLRNVDNPQQQ